MGLSVEYDRAVLRISSAGAIMRGAPTLYGGKLFRATLDAYPRFSNFNALTPTIVANGVVSKLNGDTATVIVTDANRALDMPPGRYRFGSDDDGSFFESDGKVGFVPGQGLASSVVGLDHMVRHMKKSTSATLPDAVRMASLTPAEQIGRAHV